QNVHCLSQRSSCSNTRKLRWGKRRDGPLTSPMFTPGQHPAGGCGHHTSKRSVTKRVEPIDQKEVFPGTIQGRGFEEGNGRGKIRREGDRIPANMVEECSLAVRVRSQVQLPPSSIPHGHGVVAG